MSGKWRARIIGGRSYSDYEEFVCDIDILRNKMKPFIHIGLINPKSPTNVGAVLRAAGCYGVNSVYYTGHRYDRAEKYNTDTKNAKHRIPLSGVDELLQCIAKDTALVCVELALGAQCLPNFTHPENAFYIFGPEDGTISQDILSKATAVVYVPTIGCMNLAASVNVVLYDRLAKSDLGFAGDDLIRKSRDTNNTAKVSSSRNK